MKTLRWVTFQKKKKKTLKVGSMCALATQQCHGFINVPLKREGGTSSKLAFTYKKISNKLSYVVEIDGTPLSEILLFEAFSHLVFLFWT